MTETEVDRQAERLTRLDRRLSRAIFNGRGIKLSGQELEILAAIGVCQSLSDAKVKALTDAVERRQKAKGFSEGEPR